VSQASLRRNRSSRGSSTKARRREITELATSGLREALAALEGRVDELGTSGFETREDSIITNRQSKEGTA
jgi:hypothetical protein